MSDQNFKGPPGPPRGSKVSITSWAAVSPSTGCTCWKAIPALARPPWPCSSFCRRPQGEPGVYATLSETEEELRDVAASHGWSLDGVTICELQTAEESLKADSQYTLFHPSEVELSETTRAVLDTVERVKPLRVVFDSLSEMRLLARDSLRYRRQILALKHYFTGQSCTVLLLDYTGATTGDFQLQSLTHGVIAFEQIAPGYGGQRRRVRVQKVRGVAFRDGYHDYRITTGGLAGLPAPGGRRAPSLRRTAPPPVNFSSGLPELDAMLGGSGIEPGTSLMLLGPSGVGKSTLTAQYIAAAAEPRGAIRGLYVRRGAGDLDQPRRAAGPPPPRPYRGRADHHPPGGPGRALAGRARPPHPPGGGGGHPDRGDRQPQRLPARHAGGALPGAPSPRAALLSRPAGGADLPDHGAGGLPGRVPGVAGEPLLSGRHGDPAALFRGLRRGAQGDLAGQAPHRSPREHRARAAHRRRRAAGRPRAPGVPRRAHRTARIHRRGRAPDPERRRRAGGWNVPDLEQRVLVLAPTGRDGVLACQLLSSMDVPGQACASAAELFQEIAAGAGAVILADEALQPGDGHRPAGRPGEAAPLVGPAADRVHPQRREQRAHPGDPGPPRQRHHPRAAGAPEHPGQRRQGGAARPPPPVRGARPARPPGRRRPPQGRVPGHARPRAAQSHGRHPQRPLGARRGRVAGGAGGPPAGYHHAPDPPPGAHGGRSAGRLPGDPRQDHPAAPAGRPAGRRRALPRRARHDRARPRQRPRAHRRRAGRRW